LHSSSRLFLQESKRSQTVERKEEQPKCILCLAFLCRNHCLQVGAIIACILAGGGALEERKELRHVASVNKVRPRLIIPSRSAAYEMQSGNESEVPRALLIRDDSGDGEHLQDDRHGHGLASEVLNCTLPHLSHSKQENVNSADFHTIGCCDEAWLL
jgi:hypothetical protein